MSLSSPSFRSALDLLDKLSLIEGEVFSRMNTQSSLAASRERVGNWVGHVQGLGHSCLLKLTSMRYLDMKANNPSGGVCLMGTFWSLLDMSSSCN